MKLVPIAAAAATALLALSACSSSSGGNHVTVRHSTPAGGGNTTTSAPAGAPAAAPKITIENFGYTGSLTVKAGAKVTVVNEDSVAHTLTDKKTHKFDTGNIPANGGTGTFTAPTTPGTYPFGCTYHPEMAGTLT